MTVFQHFRVNAVCTTSFSIFKGFEFVLYFFDSDGIVTGQCLPVSVLSTSFSLSVVKTWPGFRP